MHSHKHTPAPRWLNCALMHLQSQIQPLMAPTCINASLHTQNALNQLKSSALLTLKMHSTNSNPVLSLHTQNALNQIKSSALLTHSECIQPTQIKCSPYTLRMHSTNSNQDLQCWNVDTCTSNVSKYLQRAPIRHLCTSKLEMASKTSNLLQSSSKLLQGSKSTSNSAKITPPTHKPSRFSQCT
jgi:hypothetical protein